MKKALLARKIGMTQVFDEEGRAIPVTVLRAGPCTVVQVKTVGEDGYGGVQIGFEAPKEQHLNRPLKGHFKAAGVAPFRRLREFRTSSPEDFTVGMELQPDIFAPGEYVDVSAVSKGKGFAGSVKRFNFRRGPMTHGSHHHRGLGSLGAVDPARVFRGRPLPGRMGGCRRTVQNLQVARVDRDQNLLLVKGSVPGPKGVLVEVREAVKTRR